MNRIHLRLFFWLLLASLAAPGRAQNVNVQADSTTGVLWRPSTFITGNSLLTTTAAAAAYQPLDADLTAISALTTTANGRSLLTATGLTAAGLSLTNGAAIDALGAVSTAGLLTRTSANTYTARTLTGTAGQITVTNGDGVSGAPTISLPSTITQATTFSNSTASSSTITGSLINGGGFGNAGAAYIGGALNVRTDAAGQGAQAILDNRTTTGLATLWLTEDGISSKYSYLARYGSTHASKASLNEFGVVGGGNWSFAQGTVSVASTTASTSTSTGAVVIGNVSSGGLGVGGAINAGSYVATGSGVYATGYTAPPADASQRFVAGATGGTTYAQSLTGASTPAPISLDGSTVTIRAGTSLASALAFDTSRNATFSSGGSFGGPVVLKAYTAATLPTASTYTGGLAYVTDANATTRLATVAGGGSNKVIVFSDGTNWLIL